MKAKKERTTLERSLTGIANFHTANRERPNRGRSPDGIALHPFTRFTLAGHLMGASPSLCLITSRHFLRRSVVDWWTSPARLVLNNRCPMQLLSLVLTPGPVSLFPSPKHEEDTCKSEDTKHAERDTNAYTGFCTCTEPLITRLGGRGFIAIGRVAVAGRLDCLTRGCACRGFGRGGRRCGLGCFLPETECCLTPLV